MDWNYLYSLVAFVIGGLAGFQGVYERYKKDSPKASTTLAGFSYLLSRAMLPAAIFGGLYAARLIDSKLLITSLACGTGAELFLRTKIFIKQEQKGPGNIEDLLKGPLDLLRWYQNLFLEAASTSLAHSKKAFVDKHLPSTVKFQDLCERVFRNIEAYDPPPQELKAEVEKLRDEFEKKQTHEAQEVQAAIDLVKRESGRTEEEAISFLREHGAPVMKEILASGQTQSSETIRGKLEHQYRYKLGYLVYNHVGRKGFNTLLSS